MAPLSQLFSTIHQLPWPSQPYVFFPALFVFVSAYYLISPFYLASKQKAWILTAISSFTMTILSLPFVFDYLVGGMSVHAIRHTSISPLSSWSNTFFQAYLIADLIIGFFHYREHMNFLSGWVHHSLYILVNELALRRSWAHIFAFCSIMELPTFVLALGTLQPRLRSDLFFGISFFTTRIAMHLFVLSAYAKSSTRNALLGGSFMPAAILALAFGMHAMWFTQCIKGNIRRWKKRVAVKATHIANAGADVGTILEEVKVQTRGEGEGGTVVNILDPSNLEVIIEPMPAAVESELEIRSLSASLPELYRPPSDEESESSSEEDEPRLSKSEFILHTPSAPVHYPAGKAAVNITIDSGLRYRGSLPGVGTTPSATSSVLLVPGTYPALPSTSTNMAERPALRRPNSVERALQTLAALRASARTIRAQAQAQAILRARQRVRGMYDCLPDRRALYDYVGLNALNGTGALRARDVRAY